MMWTISLKLGPADCIYKLWPRKRPELRMDVLSGLDSSPAAPNQGGL